MCVHIYIYSFVCNYSIHHHIFANHISGCHEDMNCASETGSEASDVTECCAQRGKRSFRNPNDGTCQLCPGNVHT